MAAAAVTVVQANLYLINSIFPFSNSVMFDLRNIYELNLKTSLMQLTLQIKIFLKSRIHCTM